MTSDQTATLDAIILEQTGTPPRVALERGTMLASDLGLCPFDDHAEIMHEVEQQFGVEIPLVFGMDISVGGLRDMVATAIERRDSTR